jgi:hypothetical protein
VDLQAPHVPRLDAETAPSSIFVLWVQGTSNVPTLPGASNDVAISAGATMCTAPTPGVSRVASSARRHAAMATLIGAGDYMILHNVACVYGVLSNTDQADKARKKEYHDFAIDHLKRAIDLWEKGGWTGPDEILLINAESEMTFSKELKARPDFQELLKRTKPKEPPVKK